MDDDCIYCRGEGMDPASDYLLPCPHCDGTGGSIGYADDDEEPDDLLPIDPPEVPNV